MKRTSISLFMSSLFVVSFFISSLVVEAGDTGKTSQCTISSGEYKHCVGEWRHSGTYVEGLGTYDVTFTNEMDNYTDGESSSIYVSMMENSPDVTQGNPVYVDYYLRSNNGDVEKIVDSMYNTRLNQTSFIGSSVDASADASSSNAAQAELNIRTKPYPNSWGNNLTPQIVGIYLD